MKYVIRAGGVGSRLWPVSRTQRPKQFHALTSNNTMLQEAVDRVLPLTTPEQIYISTQAACVPLVTEQCPQIPERNIIAEPAHKDTAAAIGLESIIIHHADPDAIVASLGSDHSVRRIPEFHAIMRIAEACVTRYPDTIIPIGVQPTRPDTGYGYIQCGDVRETVNGTPLWNVTRFTEKPNEQQAKAFLREGRFLWNANMFVWKVSTILQLYERFLPEMYAQLREIEATLGTPEEQSTIQRIYPQLEQIAVDYAIIEKADQIAALSADIGWSDIGDWARLKDELAESESETVVIGADAVQSHTANTLIYSNTNPRKLVVTIGLKNVVIVETDDVLLVCDKYHSAEVKEIVEQLHQQQDDAVL